VEPMCIERHSPEVLLLAGPNGAGTTTSSRVLIPRGVFFVNLETKLAGRGASQLVTRFSLPVVESCPVL
jgi:hypothetical protein